MRYFHIEHVQATGETVEENDKELIESYLNGSDAAFEKLYNRFKKQLYGYLRSMLPVTEADDVFQKTWIRACSALPRYRCRGRFQAWLFRIGRNQAVDSIRRHLSRRELELEAESADFPVEQEPWRVISDEEFRCKLEEALASLSPEQQAVFEMRRNNIAFKIIAARQECPVNTAIVRMYYAMKKLRSILCEHGR